MAKATEVTDKVKYISPLFNIPGFELIIWKSVLVLFTTDMIYDSDKILIQKE